MYLKNSFYIENPYGRQVFKVYPCKTSASRNPSEPWLWAPLTFWYKLGKYDVKFIVQKNVQHRCVHSTSLPPLQKEEMVKSLSHTLLGLKSWATETVQSNWLLVSRNTRPECPVKGKGEGLLLHLSVLSGHQRQRREWLTFRPSILRRFLFHGILKECVRHFLSIL